MNRLIQLENNLIGDQESCKLLQTKEKVRMLLVSDSHGAKQALKSVIQAKGKEVDGMIFCGDGSYDLSGILEEAAVNPELMESIPSVIALARGNGDAPDCIVKFNPHPEQPADPEKRFYSLNIPLLSKFTVAGKTIIVTHGNLQGVYFGTQGLEATSKIENASAAFFGHSHIPFEMNQTVYMANPGSISLPRGGSPKSFGIVEISADYINTIFYRIAETGGKTEYVPYFPAVYSLF